jgi:CrcB protein
VYHPPRGGFFVVTISIGMKETSMGFLVVFLGGGIGAALRHGVNLAVARVLGSSFNYATLFENVSGSLVMGLLVGYFTFKGMIPQHWRLFLTTGILGGYTTFSAFSLDTILLYERGELGLAALYVIASVALSIGGLLAGLLLIRHFA